MIVCSVCRTENHHLAITCRSCGGFLQAKVENLDLFSTAWGVIERPRRAFRTIGLAVHKNFAYVLAATSGIAFVFLAFWIVKAGDQAESLLNIIAAALAVGPFFGIAALLAGAALAQAVSSIVRAPLTFRNCFALFAWSMVPVVISLLVVMPVEILSFGQFFFTTNPSPLVLRPVSYVILLGLDGLFALWTLLLQFAGLKTLLQNGWGKAVLVQIAALAPLCVSLWIARLVLKGA